MKRFHVHVAVGDLEQSKRFYSALFGSEPTVVKHDYAKWMLEDPRVNFAISQRTGEQGVNHLGFQAESDDELEEIHSRLQTADTDIAAEKGVNCCYAQSDKYWVKDPAGIAWESFRSLDSIPFYGEHSHQGAAGAEGAAVQAGSACGSNGCCPTSAAAPAEKAAKTGCCSV
jgi:catechol 2,3-dioxygenase-like lactoylglutathione lyase family enzyme